MRRLPPAAASCLGLAVSGWLLVGLAGPSMAAGGAAPSQVAPRDDTHAQVASILLRAGDQRAPAGEDAAEGLARLGARAVPELFEVLSRGAVEGGKQGRVALTDEQTRVVLAGLARMRRSDVRAVLERVATGEDPRPAERRAAVQILGAIGVEADVDLLFRLTVPADGEQDVDRPLRLAFRHALGEILERDTRAIRLLPDYYGSCAPLLEPMLEAIGSTRSREGLEACVDLLGRVPAADCLVLARIGRMSTELPWPLDGYIADEVRRYLESADRMVSAEAAMTAGRLRDALAVPALIELLDDPYAPVQQNAQHALEQITTRAYGSNRERWTEWYEEQLDWWLRSSGELLKALESDDLAEAARAVSDLSTRHFFRHELAPSLARCLARDEPELVRLICAALGRLGSGVALPDLIDCLDHHDPGVRRAARESLTRIAGRDLGDDPEAWKELLPAR